MLEQKITKLNIHASILNRLNAVDMPKIMVSAHVGLELEEG